MATSYLPRNSTLTFERDRPDRIASPPDPFEPNVHDWDEELEALVAAGRLRLRGQR